jgi:hypothetical protein
MRSRSYLGTSFAVWNGRHSWFWFVTGPGSSGAAIGAAANEAEAIREARSSIEEMSARRRAVAAPVAISEAAALVMPRPIRVGLVAIDWNESLANLDRYLSQLRDKSCQRTF